MLMLQMTWYTCFLWALVLHITGLPSELLLVLVLYFD